MAKKKSFVMYEDWGNAIKTMSDEQAGMFIKAIYAYQDDKNAAPEDPELKLVFTIVKQKLDENAEKYKATCEARAVAGKRGGETKASKS